LKARLKRLAHGMAAAEVLKKFKTIEMFDLHLPMADHRTPTTDGRKLVLSRDTQPEAEHRILEQVGLRLSQQLPPKVTAEQPQIASPSPAAVVETFG
jgi:hypothetical protein